MKFNRVKMEKKVLAILLKSKKASIKVLPLLHKGLFTNRLYKNVFLIAKDHYEKYYNFPKKSFIIEELNNRKEKDIDKYDILLDKLHDFVNVDPNDINFYMNKLDESYKARKIIKVVDSGLELVSQGKIKDSAEYIQLNLSKLTDSVHKEDMIGDYVSDFEKRQELIIEKKDNPEKYRGIPTGIKDFDDYYGGVLEEELAIVVGGTGKGKSIALMNFAVTAWLKGYDVVIVTIEMSKMEYEFRIDSRLANIVHRKFRKAELTDDDMKLWASKIKKYKENKKNKLHIIDIPEGCTADFIEMKLMTLKNQLQDKFLLVVDYLNLMNSKYTRSSDEDRIKQGAVSREMKALARSWRIPIWTAAQLKAQSVKKKSYDSEDAGRSAGISQNANIMVGLIQNKEDELDGIMRMVSMKGRDGRFKDILLHPDLEKMRMNIKSFTTGSK